MKQDRPSQRLKRFLEQELKKLPSGALLPTGDQLAEQFGVSPTTVRRLFEKWARDGRLQRVPRKGTMIPGPDPAPPKLVTRESSSQSLAQKLIQSITSGEFKRGEALPSIKRLRWKYRMSPSNITKALDHLQEMGHVTRVGRTSWVGAPHPQARPKNPLPVYIFRDGPLDFTPVFHDEEFSYAYRKMILELQVSGFLVKYASLEQFDGLVAHWIQNETLPGGLVFHYINEKQFVAVKPTITRLQKELPKWNVPVLVDWREGNFRMIPRGFSVLSRGNIMTQMAKTFAEYILHMGRPALHIFKEQNAWKGWPFWWYLKIRTELRHLNHQAEFPLVVVGQLSRKNLISEFERIVNKKKASYTINKYSETPFTEVEDDLHVAKDYDEVRVLFPQKNMWCFSPAEDAAQAVEWARRRSINVPRDLAIMCSQRDPKFYHIGITHCEPDWERIGYLMAHAIIQDFPLEKTRKGFLRSHAILVEDMTTLIDPLS